ncbi:carboxypeptidase s [Phaffia rhodozyma]|uniref:Carboxypeptidase s n=1 Tax=Phaffia rhodozyma TaxID=264483 RepID=A0A0F7SIS4_PHARH|nr:carboxypeptidase s [Phaffia rhodozyma]
MSLDEKNPAYHPESLPLPGDTRPAKSSSALKSFRKAILPIFLLTQAFYYFGLDETIGLTGRGDGGRGLDAVGAEADGGLCYQHEPLWPKTDFYKELDKVWKSDAFKDQAVEWLGGAVRVETESYDGMDEVGKDGRWHKFQKFHDYLEKSYPLVHKHLKLDKVNTYGLVFEWTGSDSSLKPLLLTGHQDVVPVEKSTYDAWIHPPFSGHYDGTYIWGRGSIDDKSGTIGIMSAVESLLRANKDYTPKRTIVLAFGMDEEVSGFKGAAHIAKYLEDTYTPKFGSSPFGLLVDEGGGYTKAYGKPIAALGTGEKGYGDVRMTVKTLGGHSSVPPDHTGIGLLSLLVAHLEANPHKANLTRSNPFYSTLTCAAEYAPDVNTVLRKLIKASAKSNKALGLLETFLDSRGEYRSLVKTTQAVDLIGGGIKVNALPETAFAVINHRINVASSTEELRQRITSIVEEKAKELNLTLSSFGKDVLTHSGVGHVELTEAFDKWLEPSPLTPTTKSTNGWKVLSGTIKGAYASRLKESDDDDEDDEIITSPSIMTGNTDTKYYWNLTDQIYRYNHLTEGDMYTYSGIHSVNEALKAVAFVNNVRFFGGLMLNVDSAEL